MKPSECPTCAAEFESRPMLQTEITHEVAKYGPLAGRILLNERLEGIHEEHE